MKDVQLAGIALIVALALSLGGSAKAVQAQTLFGLAHEGPNGPSTLYRINSATGGFDPVGSGTTFQRCSGMDFDASGTLFATCERDEDDPNDIHVLITIDPSTGIGTGVEVGPTGIESLNSFEALSTFTTASDISFPNSDGPLFAYLRTTATFNFLATIDIETGTATLKPAPLLTFGRGNGIAISPGNELFHADEFIMNILNQSSGVAIPDFAVELTFPAVECPDQFPTFDCRVNAMDFSPAGTLFASVNHKVDGPAENFLATIDTETGVVTIKGLTVPGLDAIAFAPAAPATPDPPYAELGDLKCYKVKRTKYTPKLGKIEVELNDSFDSEDRLTRVEKAETVCTPVVGKDSTAPSTPSLTCYKIEDVKWEPKFQHLDVIVGNELFGQEQALTLEKAKVLCVPSTIAVVP